MTLQSEYRWLKIAGFVTLALAALVLVVAVKRAATERRTREDVGVRVQEMMNTLEAEAQRMENAASRP